MPRVFFAHHVLAQADVTILKEQFTTRSGGSLGSMVLWKKKANKEIAAKEKVEETRLLTAHTHMPKQ